MSSLVLVPLAPASLVPESLAAVFPPLAFLALISRVIANVASLVLSFVGLVKLVPTSLASPPALVSPLFSIALISTFASLALASLVRASLALASLALTSHALVSLALISLALASLALISPVYTPALRAL